MPMIIARTTNLNTTQFFLSLNFLVTTKVTILKKKWKKVHNSAFWINFQLDTRIIK